MRKIHPLFLFLSLPVYLAAQCSSAPARTGLYPGSSGLAEYAVMMPSPASCYNGAMVLFAHGYVAPGSPVGTWETQLFLPDGTSLPALLNSAGFGFAASSYSKEGLAILQGVEDTRSLIGIIGGLGIPVRKYFAAGASEGGLVAAKLVEEEPRISGGVAVCGPVGSFQKEINYIADVRVLFDYFFPGVLIGGSAIDIPASLMIHWRSVYEPAVREALKANPLATLQLLSTANIPVGPDLASARDAIVDALRYNVFGSNDNRSTLGGNAFDNIGRFYHGSLNDLRLNAGVARFAADPAAIISLAGYETTGKLDDPLITLHTTADPLVPFEQEVLYKAKALLQGSGQQLLQTPILRYGHCNVTTAEASAALLLMISKAGL